MPLITKSFPLDKQKLKEFLQKEYGVNFTKIRVTLRSNESPIQFKELVLSWTEEEILGGPKRK